MQEKQFIGTEIQPANQLNVGVAIQTDSPTLQQSVSPTVNQPSAPTDLGLSSVFGIFTSEPSPEELKQPTTSKKKKEKP